MPAGAGRAVIRDASALDSLRGIYRARPGNSAVTLVTRRPPIKHTRYLGESPPSCISSRHTSVDATAFSQLTELWARLWVTLWRATTQYQFRHPLVVLVVVAVVVAVILVDILLTELKHNWQIDTIQYCQSRNKIKHHIGQFVTGNAAENVTVRYVDFPLLSH